MFITISPFASGSVAQNGSNVSNVVLCCAGKKGHIIDIRLGFHSRSLPAGDGLLSEGIVSPTPSLDHTSMIFWEL